MLDGNGGKLVSDLFSSPLFVVRHVSSLGRAAYQQSTLLSNPIKVLATPLGKPYLLDALNAPRDTFCPVTVGDYVTGRLTLSTQQSPFNSL
jgi:hypothetical protein